ncbi:unnamed protein product, partial [Discosporangium mesarthrocarpum]
MEQAPNRVQNQDHLSFLAPSLRRTGSSSEHGIHGYDLQPPQVDLEPRLGRRGFVVTCSSTSHGHGGPRGRSGSSMSRQELCHNQGRGLGYEQRRGWHVGSQQASMVLGEAGQDADSGMDVEQEEPLREQPQLQLQLQQREKKQKRQQASPILRARGGMVVISSSQKSSEENPMLQRDSWSSQGGGGGGAAMGNGLLKKGCIQGGRDAVEGMEVEDGGMVKMDHPNLGDDGTGGFIVGMVKEGCPQPVVAMGSSVRGQADRRGD